MIKILVITPINHLKQTKENLHSIGEVDYYEEINESQLCAIIENYDAIFTNPNKSKVFLGKNVLKNAKKLKVICTASTGTNHIDKAYIKKKNIDLISITEERSVIRKISSTAEHAFALTISSLRNIVDAHLSVENGNWDYLPFIGRQLSNLTVGVIGYGRLGTLYANYCQSFGSRVIVYDPYKTVYIPNIEQVDNLYELAKISNIVSIHVHVSDETNNLLDTKFFKFCKKDVLIVNTSRGEVVDESALVNFLTKNSKSKYATDVIKNETHNRHSSPIYDIINKNNQVTITPHIAGMTVEAQEMAFNHASSLLIKYFNK